MSKKLLGVAAVAAFISAVSPASASVNLLTNGSFETGTYVNGGSNFETLFGGSNAINGWVVNSGSIDWINTYWGAGAGNFSVDMSGNGAGSISQSFNSTVGQTYNVSFMLGGNPDGGPTVKSIDVFINGELHTFTFDTTGVSKNAMGWQTFSFNFTSNTAIQNLTFASSGESPWGPAIDNVSVSAVPEASTWMMMLIGFAGIGFITYRRARKLPVAFAS